MPPGGKRPGAGRPKGARNKRSAALLERLQAEKCDPVDACMDVLRRAIADGDADLTLRAAKELMPYAYPKLSSQSIDLNAFLPDSVSIRVEMMEGES